MGCGAHWKGSLAPPVGSVGRLPSHRGILGWGTPKASKTWRGGEASLVGAPLGPSPLPLLVFVTGSGLHGVMVCEARQAGKVQGCLCGQEGEKCPRRRTWGPPWAGPSPPDPPRRSLGPRWSCLRLSRPRRLGQPGLQHRTQQHPPSSPGPQSCTPPPSQASQPLPDTEMAHYHLCFKGQRDLVQMKTW